MKLELKLLLTKNFILYNCNGKYAAACIFKFLELRRRQGNTGVSSSGDTSKLKKHQAAKVVKKLHTVMTEPRPWL